MTIATAHRVLLQLRHDPRTIALLIVVPSLLMALMRYVFDSSRAFNALAPSLLGIFPFTIMFLVTSITTLRERTGGTLERLMTTRIRRLDLLVGYALAFGLIALVQVLVAVGTSAALGMSVGSRLGWLLLLTVVNAQLGVAIGLFASAFARTEFQAIQFMPVVVLPQLLLCGLFQPRGEMATALARMSDALPMSYAVDALQRLSADPEPHARFFVDLAVVAGSAVAALVLAAATMRRSSS